MNLYCPYLVLYRFRYYLLESTALASVLQFTDAADRPGGVNCLYLAVVRPSNIYVCQGRGARFEGFVMVMQVRR